MTPYMIYHGFQEDLDRNCVRSVESWQTVDPLFAGMEERGSREVWGLHRVPFLVGENALFPLFGSWDTPRRAALLGAHTSASFPGEANVRLVVPSRGNEKKIGRPLLVPEGGRPNFSNVLKRAPGFDTLVCCIRAVDQATKRDAMLLGESDSGRELTPLRVDAQTMSIFLTMTADILEGDFQA